MSEIINLIALTLVILTHFFSFLFLNVEWDGVEIGDKLTDQVRVFGGTGDEEVISFAKER